MTHDEAIRAMRLSTDYVNKIVVESDGYPMEHSADMMRTLLANAFLAGYRTRHEEPVAAPVGERVRETP